MNSKKPTQNEDSETQEIKFIDAPVFSEIQTVEHPECTPNKMYDPGATITRIVVTVREMPDDYIPFDILNEPLYTWPDED